MACTPQAVQQQQAARLAAVRLEHACGTTLAALCPREKLIPIPGHAIRAADGSGLLMVPAYQRITFIPGQTTVDENGVTKTTPNRRMYCEPCLAAVESCGAALLVAGDAWHLLVVGWGAVGGGDCRAGEGTANSCQCACASVF